MLMQIFIYVNVLLAGAAIAMACVYFYQHRVVKKQPDDPAALKADVPSLSKETQERILHEAEEHFQLTIKHAVGELQYDLKDTSDGITGRLRTLSDDLAGTEMKRYKDTLEELRQQTEVSLSEATSDVTKYQTQLLEAMKTHLDGLDSQLAQEMANRKKQLIDQVDKKLAGAITAFLTETLGHNVDLGAQVPYLTKTLEEHKAELIKELNDEA